MIASGVLARRNSFRNKKTSHQSLQLLPPGAFQPGALHIS